MNNALMAEILIVEDERHIADVLAFLLQEKGWQVRRAEDGTTALSMVRQQKPDLILLDLHLPGIPGLPFMKQVRARHPAQAIVILTAQGEEDDRVRGMEAGADDYVCKPFNNRELVARVQAVLRRTLGAPPREQDIVQGPLRLDPAGFRLCIAKTHIDLAKHEFSLMEALMRHPTQVFTRDQLIAKMYAGDEEVFDNAVDTTVWRLRKKVREIRPDLNPIKTIYGLGYRFSGESS
ncbi:MAG: response regulator transcription factor [Verrucomicrobia bacterium]|nr:response regulator transcription factor [Verrucomicrobiota bacterium]